MLEYHKIQSVYQRDPATKHKGFVIGAWSIPAFGYLATNDWLWSEKIDGTNVRVIYDGETVRFNGRTNDAQMPVFLMERVQALFPAGKLREVFPEISNGVQVYLFGEGYGAKIQKGGGLYKADGCDFILFDVMVNGVYLERENVRDVADKLGIGVVAIVGRGSLYGAIDAAKAGFPSVIGTARAEGLVMRPSVELVDRMGRRIIAKVKTRDFAFDAVPA